MSTIRIATRGSDLALAQSNAMAERIRKELGAETELVVIRTTGDRIQNVSLAKIGGKGLFVKEIEEALLDLQADVAVHSAKDLPAEIAPGLTLAAFPERADPRDALVGRADDLRLDSLRERARVGTGSARRSAQLRALRPDLEIVPLRGNVPTRIAKLESEALDAVVLACAGVDRLALGEFVRERIDPARMLPAAGQGTIALETRSGDGLARALAELDDADAALAIAAERAFLRRLGGDCSVPLAAYATRDGDSGLRLRALISDTSGRRIVRDEAVAPLRGDVNAQREAAAELGEQVAQRMLEDGGHEIMAELRAQEGT